MSVTILRPKSREEWLILRQRGIGSSEVATIIGLNPWETPYQLWRRKKGLDEPKEENFAMKAGHYLEDAVSKCWEDETGRTIIKRSATDWIVKNNEKPFLQASPDRTYWSGDIRNAQNKGILECKTTQREIEVNNIPKYWFVQLQYLLGTAGIEHGSLAWLSSGRHFGYKDIDLVPDFYAWLVEEVERFWRDNIEAGIEPDIINGRDAQIKYSKHTEGKEREVNEATAKACEKLRTIKDKIKDLESEQADLESEIKTAFGDAERITSNGIVLATWKAPKPSKRFDVDALKKEDLKTYERFLKEVQGSRRFLLK